MSQVFPDVSLSRDKETFEDSALESLISKAIRLRLQCLNLSIFFQIHKNVPAADRGN